MNHRWGCSCSQSEEMDAKVVTDSVSDEMQSRELTAILVERDGTLLIFSI